MSTSSIVIGPTPLSAEQVRLANQKQADSWKGHRLMSLPPLLVILFMLPTVIERPTWTNLIAFVVPQLILFLGALLLRPYREIRSIECNYRITDEKIVMESRVDGKKPGRFVAKWRDTVGFEEDRGAITLFLRSGDRPRIFKECFSLPEHRDLLFARIHSALPRLGQTSTC